MAILSSMQSAAIRLVGRKPGVFFGAEDVFEMEITDLINEVAKDIAKYQDWQALTTFAEIIGDGEATGFDLPIDYDRMLLNSSVQDEASWAWGYLRVMDFNEYLYLVDRGWGPAPGVWTILQDRMFFTPAPSSNSAAKFPYISTYIARDAGTQALKTEFTSDTDLFLLPERLLTLGLVWRWRENKKLDASGDQEAFIKALDEYAAKEKGARVYRSNAGRRIPGVGVAWPWTLGGLG